jgi:hypothetical protein
MEPITSEQELKTLLDEGKITQEEYHELLAAMKDKPRQNPVELSPGQGQDKPKTRLGRASLVLFLVSLILPWVVIVWAWLLASSSRNSVGTKLSFAFLALLVFIALLCGLLAFIFGIIAWKTTPGKIAVLGTLLAVVCFPFLFAFLGLIGGYRSAAHSEGGSTATQLYRTYSCDSLDSLIVGQTGTPYKGNLFAVEKGILSEDKGAIRIQVLEANTFHLYETGPLEKANNTMLFYQAKVRTEALNGKAYLELWCSIPGKGEFFSRFMDQPISGTNNWTTLQIPFRNDSGINPDNVKLNLVVEGTGTVWIDDIRLTGQSL